MNYKSYFLISMLFIFTFMSIFTVKVSYADGAETGLVAHYTFDGDVKDSSGNGNDGRSIGEISFVDGKIGKGAKFDGSSYIQVGDSSDLDLTNAFTFSVWLYKEKPLGDGVRMPVICKGESDDFWEAPYRLILGYGSTHAEICLIAPEQNESAEHSSDASVPTQNWTHLVVTWDGTRATFFKNGAISTVIRTNINTIYFNDHDLLIGADTVDGNFYHGIMDDLRIYNKALSDVEVRALYESQSTTPTTQPQTPPDPSIAVPQGLMAYYAFDGNFNDTSGYGNNGSPIGNVPFVDGKVGKAAKFDGASYVFVKDNDSLDLPDAFTFCAWLCKEPQDEGRTAILCKGETDGFFDVPYRYFLGYGADYPEICLIDELQSSSEEHHSNTIVENNQWTHVSVSWDGRNVRFYKNGVLSDPPIETEYITSMLCNDQNLVIGMDSVARTFYKGIIDELRIYNRALSDAEIKTVYDVKPAAAAPTTPTPVTTPAAPGQLSDLKPTTPGLPEEPTTSIILQIDNPKMVQNGIEKEIDPGYGTKPIVLNGRTLLPVRAIIESLRGTVGWDQAEQKVTLEVNDSTIIMWIGRTDYLVNGVTHTLDVAPIVINGRTLLPIRALLENIGYVVEWNNDYKAVIIVSTD
ncbi:MAG: LamG-like jellyroll fold domain-containing protein [Tepidanaerobacteraceae bacterium]|jgi:hypothetical protein|nr:hypothetical protein [Thermoanaerobacterales bacterium]